LGPLSTFVTLVAFGIGSRYRRRRRATLTSPSAASRNRPRSPRFERGSAQAQPPSSFGLALSVPVGVLPGVHTENSLEHE
jgi:hypothetical protein